MNNDEVTFTVIGVVESCFKQKFGIPRQPGLVPSAKAIVWIFPPYNEPDAFQGLSQCSHLWIQFVFHKTEVSKPWRPKIRPPRLGGNKSLGVFASRSPNRPNPLGLSVVKNEGIILRDNRLGVQISGVDLLDGTPVLDVKPYLPYVDAVACATNTIAQTPPELLPVYFSEHSKAICNAYKMRTQLDLKQLIAEVLSQDPRPQYQKEICDRTYGMLLLDMDVQWIYVIQDQVQTVWVSDILSKINV